MDEQRPADFDRAPPSPTPSQRSFLDEDPFPSGRARTRSSVSRPWPVHVHDADDDDMHNVMDDNTRGETDTAAAMLARLESFLVDKANQIQVCGRLGEALLSQQAELEARIRELTPLKASLAQLNGRGPAAASLSASTSSRRLRLAQHDADADADAVERDQQQQQQQDDEQAQELAAIGAETRKKLAALESEMQKWDEGNEELFRVVNNNNNNTTTTNAPSSSTPAQDDLTASSSSVPDLPTSPERQPTSSSSARRARNNNAQHRTNDIELATEIGTHLLSEVRRLQALITERDEALRDVAEDKETLERALEASNAARKAVEENVEKYKDENWNLEVATQELRVQMADAQAASHKADQERVRTTRELAAVREQLDTHKLEAERVQASLEALRAKHDTDLATMRKRHAGLARDKSDLQSALDGLRTEMAAKARKSLARDAGSGSPLTPGSSPSPASFDPDLDPNATSNGDDPFRPGNTTARRKTGEGFMPSADLFGAGTGRDNDNDDDALDNSPLIKTAGLDGASNNPEALRSALAHAHKQLAAARTALQREKTTGLALKRQLANASTTSGADDSTMAWEDESALRASTPATRVTGNVSRGGLRGSARGRGSAARRRAAVLRGAPTPSRLGREVESDSDDGGQEQQSEGEEDDDESQAGSIFAHNYPLNMGDESVDDDRSSIVEEDGRGDDDERSFAASIPGDLSGRRSSLTSLLGKARPASIASITRSLPRSSSGAVADTSVTEVVEEEEPAPAKTFVDAGTMTEPEPEVPKVAVMDIAVQTDFVDETPVVVETAVQTDGPVVLVHAATSTDRVAQADASVATDLVETAAAPAPGHDIEVQTEPEPLQPVSLNARSRAPTVSSSHNKAMSVDTTDFVSIAPSDEDEHRTRRPGTATPTDTDDFVDARETIGVETPYSYTVSSTRDYHTDAGDDSDSGSVATTAYGETRHRSLAAEDETEVLRDSPMRARQPEQPRVVTIDMGIQTDPWEPAPIVVAAPSAPAESVASHRDSINTFGRARTPEDLNRSAARAAAYLERQTHDGTVSLDEPARSESAMSDRELSDAALMPPPPLPMPRRVGPRKSSASGLSTRSTTTKVAPPRPTSPPPADLLHRAQSPVFDQPLASPGLLTPGGHASQQQQQQQVGSMRPPPVPRLSTQNLRGALRSMGPSPTSGSLASDAMLRSPSKRSSRRKQSAVTTASDASSMASRRLSVASSRSSDDGEYQPVSRAPVAGDVDGGSTDPAVIHAITQTMIGEFLYKYTRRAIGSGFSEKRHKRFFWVHPYTKTLYWSSVDPGAQSTNQSSAKSVFIEGVTQVVDTNAHPPGLHYGSLVIKTPGRDIKLTAPTRERHEMWLDALSYLLARPEANNNATTSAPASPVSARTRRSERTNGSSSYFETPSASRILGGGGDAGDLSTVKKRSSMARRSGARASDASMDAAAGAASDSGVTPKPTRRPSLANTLGSARGRLSLGGSSKRVGTAADEYERTASTLLLASPRHVRSFGSTPGAGTGRAAKSSSRSRASSLFGDAAYESVELVSDDYHQAAAAARANSRAASDSALVHEDPEAHWDGIENVRACCGGKHDVGSLSKHHHHGHHGGSTSTTTSGARKSLSGLSGVMGSSTTTTAGRTAKKHSNESSSSERTGKKKQVLREARSHDGSIAGSSASAAARTRAQSAGTLLSGGGGHTWSAASSSSARTRASSARATTTNTTTTTASSTLLDTPTANGKSNGSKARKSRQHAAVSETGVLGVGMSPTGGIGNKLSLR